MGSIRSCDITGPKPTPEMREEETTRGFILCGDTNVIGYMTDGFKVRNAPKCQ
jgi:hypothetical protein